MRTCLATGTLTSLALLLAACGNGSATPPPDQPPTLAITGPVTDLELAEDVGGTVVIQYVDNDPDEIAHTDLFADRDGNLDTTGDQVVIAIDLPEMDGAPQVFPWDTSGTPAGAYHIVARTTGGTTRVVATGSGMVQLNAAPTISLVAPTAEMRVARGGFLAVELIADDADDAATIWVYADEDGDPATSYDSTQLASLLPEQDGATLALCLGVGALDVGTYGLVACIWDGTNAPVCAVAAGTIRIDDAATTIVAAGAGHESFFDIAIDDAGTMTAVCGMSGTTTFGAGQVNETTFSTLGGQDPVIVRYDRNGELMWARHIGGPDFDAVSGIGLRSDGSVVVAGELRSSLTFAMGEMNETTLNSLGTSDLWVAHYNNDGTLDWVRAAGGGGTFDNPYTLEVLPDDTTLVVGRFGSTCTFGSGEANETMLVTAGDHDGFVARFAANGDLLFARSFGGTGFDECQGLTVATDGSSFVAGSFGTTCTFGPGEAGETMLTASGTRDLFVARYAANGDLLWVRAIAGTGGAHLGRVALLPGGHFGASFCFDGEAVFGPGEVNETTLTSAGGIDSAVARYSADGDLQWVRHLSSAAALVARDVAAYKDGSLLVAIHTEGSVTLGAAEPREQSVDVASGEFLLAACFGPDGRFRWVVVGAETATLGEVANRVRVGPDGAGYLLGNFSGTMTFFEGQTSERTLPFVGDEDALIVRFNADGY